MTRLRILTREEAPPETQPVLDGLHKQLGFIPNLSLVMAQSPNSFNGFIGLQKSLSKTLDPKLRARISLAVSEVNQCQYCLTAHSYVAKHAHHLSTEEVALNRGGHSSDAKADAAVQFAKRVTETRGNVTDAELLAVRNEEFTDAQIVEIVATAIQFLFTNFINNVADTEIDFPAEITAS
jgi:uncharacterized peroxidase-related enzyme